ncbi:hypothetical protein ONZ45_g16067 [Pleurotus djamor]|nr:hypothetical protein ONZ45_g16067 [Pleurotus djamor]
MKSQRSRQANSFKLQVAAKLKLNQSLVGVRTDDQSGGVSSNCREAFMSAFSLRALVVSFAQGSGYRRL